jgi:hypothetical protein
MKSTSCPFTAIFQITLANRWNGGNAYTKIFFNLCWNHLQRMPVHPAWETHTLQVGGPRQSRLGWCVVFSKTDTASQIYRHRASTLCGSLDAHGTIDRLWHSVCPECVSLWEIPDSPRTTGAFAPPTGKGLETSTRPAGWCMPPLLGCRWPPVPTSREALDGNEITLIRPFPIPGNWCATSGPMRPRHWNQGDDNMSTRTHHRGIDVHGDLWWSGM